MENAKPEWSTQNIKKWTKIDDKTASLIIAQVETALKESIDTAKGISDKGYKFLTVLIPLISGLTIYLIDVFYKKTGAHNDFLIGTTIVAIIICLISLFFTVKMIWPYKVGIPGHWPDEIVTTEMIDEGDEKQLHLKMVMNISESIQSRLKVNALSNAERTRNSYIALIALCSIPLSPVIAYLVLNFPDYLLCPHHRSF